MTTTNSGIALIVHGGVGTVSEELAKRRSEGCRQAAMAGYSSLQRSVSAVEAVEAAIRVLEDDPVFNAGTGSTLNAAGRAELDASIMDGNTLEAGAVAAVRHIHNPISLARRVMEESRHVLLVGEGAERFGQSVGAEFCAPEELIVDHQRAQWESEHGTVGCVAIDSQGIVAAGTSTGGTFNALPGRVGDSPLIGCGTYANEFGGISCTGLGEAIIRCTLGRFAADQLAAGSDPDQAARDSISELERRTGADSEAGLIIIDTTGRIGYAHNGKQMPVCMINADGTLTSAD